MRNLFLIPLAGRGNQNKCPPRSIKGIPYFYVTDGYAVYPCFISNEDHIVSKTYMTRVESENSRFRHYLARLHRKTFCYSKSEEMLKLSIRLVTHYLKYGSLALRALCARKLEAIA